MLIGYSFWGFLGVGITDTPDGGRSHRRVLIDGLKAAGHDIVFLQSNRDRDEAGTDLTSDFRWDCRFPGIDALFLEWRWPIAGRNTTECGEPGHTCDLHRQQELLDHYTATGVATVLWDKDRQLPANDPLRHTANIAVCEPALHPTPGALTLLFPVADAALDDADPRALASRCRDLPLVYVGNQYDRDEAFTRYFADAAARCRHLVAGKWTSATRWSGVSFTGRIPFPDVEPLYARSLTTMLLLPGRYAQAGQMTQRLLEAVLAGCLPLTPDSIRSSGRFTPAQLHVTSGAHAAVKIGELAKMAGTAEHANLLERCVVHLDLFRLSRQIQAAEAALARAQPRRAIR